MALVQSSSFSCFSCRFGLKMEAACNFSAELLFQCHCKNNFWSHKQTSFPLSVERSFILRKPFFFRKFFKCSISVIHGNQSFQQLHASFLMRDWTDCLICRERSIFLIEKVKSVSSVNFCFFHVRNSTCRIFACTLMHTPTY